ncbi:MAG TPA: glutamate-cysteine ligase family protein, partial [Mariprofundaceae bacterium]|nr:glutamate-cysteine ligase family protein [Mariprofundaceae bacterium]
GMPFYFQNWQDFEHCAERLLATGSIDSVRDIWWEMRPHPDFGTLEVRIGDMPASKGDTTAYIAYVRSEAIAAIGSEPSKKVHPSLIRENRWRASRYGMATELIDPVREEPIALLDWLESRTNWLATHGAEEKDLSILAAQIEQWRSVGDGSVRQRKIYDQSGDLEKVVAVMQQQDGWS